MALTAIHAPGHAMVEKRKTPWRNLVVGACINVIQASANRSDSLKDAVKKTWARAGFRGFYQGLIPWILTEKLVQAWIEASTKGAILVLTSTEVEYYARSHGLGHSTAGVLGGVVGGASQAYLTMGRECPPSGSVQDPLGEPY
ncbi:mitochondrial dna replication protein [Colletotrichum tofieldiae]|nr:mitochondrial dna replication protein [Colletotrichum tofieldiae]